jgi:general stress protein YciG
VACARAARDIEEREKIGREEGREGGGVERHDAESHYQSIGGALAASTQNEARYHI